MAALWITLSMILFGLTIPLAHGQQQTLADVSGEDIVALMQVQTDKCPGTTTDNMQWAPLPKDQPCGTVKRCDFPNQWCAFKSAADGTPDIKTLACKPISDPCKQSFQQVFGGATGAPGASAAAPGASTAAPGASSSPSSADTTLSSGASTPGDLSTQPTGSAGTGETTAQSSGGTTVPVSGEISTESTTGSWIGGGPTDAGMSSSDTPPTPGEIGAMTTAAPISGGGGGSSPQPPGECCDYHEYCCFWASTGECDKNKNFMLGICQKSCGTCGCTGASCTVNVASTCAAGTADVPPGQACPCTSGHLVNKDWSPKCAGWAAKGECDKNTAYMKAICKVSCKVCS